MSITEHQLVHLDEHHDAAGAPCKCGGYAERVEVCDTPDEIWSKYGCGRRGCCSALFKCRLCGASVVGTFDAPDLDYD